MNNVITVNLDEKCAECRKGGATACGLCLGCATKAMDSKRAMKSPQGRQVQARWVKQFAEAKQPHVKGGES